MFSTSTPVTDTAFFDRTVELKRLAGVITALRQGTPRWLAILGVRRVGKTSLVLELVRRDRHRDVRFVVLDCMEDDPLGFGIFHHLALRTVDAFFARELGTSVASLARRPDEYRATLPESKLFRSLDRGLRADLLSLADAPKDVKLAELALGLPERLAVATRTWCVVAWDEFQELSKLPPSRGGVLSLARAIWQRHKRTTYVIAGSERGLLRQLVTSERSPFFQHFDLMELGTMKPEDATALLRQAGGRARLSDEVIALAILTLGGHPFYLQMFGEHLVRYPPPWDVALARQVMSELLFTRNGALSLFFAREFDRLVGSASTLAATLEGLADGPLRTNELARRTGANSGAMVRYLERLGDAVTRDAEQRWSLSDPVFALWLRWRQPGGAVVPMSVIGDDAEKEVARLLAEYGFELVYQSRASRGAFDLLGVRSGLQVGVQVKRTTLPLRMSGAAWARLHADAQRLGWRATLAVVTPENRVFFFDPATARVARNAVVDERQALPNLLAWLRE
ncbi:MAG: ATP-binding protein [Archangium sp.]|nr:ATP-binding protein [Archangium sp.]